MYAKTAVAALLAAAAPALAHMEMSYPAPLLSHLNANTPSGSALDTYTAPLSGRTQFPCNGSTALAAIGQSAGAAVDTWAPGSTHNATITGGAFHGGGSCQFALSYDKGTTFKVIKSFIGSCPTANGDSSYNFDVPSDAPEGTDVLFAWTWFNHIGNREMYMNCAVVNIASSGSKRSVSEEENRKRAVAFNSRPNIFVANIDGTSGCQTKEGIDVEFPNPGEEVETNTSTPGLYVDESLCSDPNDTGAGTPSSSGGSNGDTGSSSSAGSGTTTAAATSTAAATTTKAAASTTSVPGGVFVTTPTGAATTSTAAAANPTTLATTTKAATTTTKAATSAVASSTATPSSGSGTTTGAFTAGTACTTEGEWNCISGSSFQRCASGQWSAVQQMASGTTCTSGTSDTLQVSRKRGSRIYRRAL